MGNLLTEFLMVLFLSLSLAAAISSGLSGENRALGAKAGDFQSVALTEAALRAVETAMNSGADVDGSAWEGAAQWRAEHGHIRIGRNGRVVEARGVFCDDSSEPV